MELNYAIADDSKKSGNLLPVNYGVTNLGENDVKKLNVKIYTDKNVYFTKTVPCNIKPGETWNFIEKVDVSKVASETDATVSVLSDDESDITNNTDKSYIG